MQETAVMRSPVFSCVLLREQNSGGRITAASRITRVLLVFVFTTLLDFVEFRHDSVEFKQA